MESGIFKENQWKEWEHMSKRGKLSREYRIKKGKEYLKTSILNLLKNQVRGGRYVVEKKIFELENDDF